MQICNPSTVTVEAEGSEVGSQLWLQSKFKASLGCMRFLKLPSKRQGVWEGGHHTISQYIQIEPDQ